MAKRATAQAGDKGERSGRSDGGRDGRSRRPTRRRAGGSDKKESNPVLEWTKSIVVAVVLFLFLRTFLVQTFVITSGSMENTLLVGDMLVVNRASMGSTIPLTGIRIPGYSQPHRGDVIVFEPPPPDTVNMKLVKRLIGLPGDTLQMRNRVLYVDGKPQEEPYLKHTDVGDETHPWMEWQKSILAPGIDPRTYAPTRDNWGPLIIPEGRYFMMGDNRETSFDSRYWGLLERWRLEGRVVFVYFSYNRDSYRPFPWLREIRWGRIGSVIH
jgi:signal peptidase I